MTTNPVKYVSTEAFLDPQYQHKCDKSYQSAIIFYEHSQTFSNSDSLFPYAIRHIG